MSQMKEKDKTKAEEVNEMEISNMLDKFKVTVIKILTGLENKVENLSETFNKVRKYIFKNSDEELNN